MEEKERKETRERIGEEVMEKLEKIKEELKKTGEKTAEEISATLSEIGKDLEYFTKDLANFFKEAAEKPQVQEAIVKTKSWLATTLKAAADALSKVGRELEGFYEADEDAPAGEYACIRCGYRLEHRGGKLPHCPKCGGTTFKLIKKETKK